MKDILGTLLHKLRPRTRKVPPLSSPLEDTVSGVSRVPGQAPASFRLVRVNDLWKPYETFHTTGEFAHAGHKSFRSHCGPTAMTNLLCTLHARYHYPGLEGRTPEEIFLACARVGRRHLLFWNMALLGRFGGTSYFVTGPYMRLCLREFGITDISVSVRLFTTPGNADRQLRSGALCLVQLLFHRTYGSHMAAAYGSAATAGPQGQHRRYLLLSDGWSSAPRYLSEENTKVLGLTILKKKGT